MKIHHRQELPNKFFAIHLATFHTCTLLPSAPCGYLYCVSVRVVKLEFEKLLLSKCSICYMNIGVTVMSVLIGCSEGMVSGAD